MIRDSNVDGNSKARNPKIQNMLRMIGFRENIGSGFPKIIAVWKETNWGEPELKNNIEVDEVELVLLWDNMEKIINIVCTFYFFSSYILCISPQFRTFVPCKGSTN